MKISGPCHIVVHVLEFFGSQEVLHQELDFCELTVRAIFDPEVHQDVRPLMGLVDRPLVP